MIVHFVNINNYLDIPIVLFRSLNLPDMCLAAFEIGRRAYEYKKQFTNKKKV